MSASTSKTKVIKPVEPPLLKTGQQRKSAAKSPRGKKSNKAPETLRVSALKSNAVPSAFPLEDVIETMIFEPSAPPLELLEPPSAPMKKRKTKINKEIMKTLKKEDEKYKGINFDMPPADWSKEDQSKMRGIIRTMSMEYKKQWNKERVRQLGHEVRNSGHVEMALARDIIGLLQKDVNLMGYMKLQHLAFSTFSNKTYDWKKVSELLNHKFTPAECEEFWYMELYPRIKNMGFSPANEKQLMELAVANKFQHWDVISENIIGHTEYQCYVHFRRNLYKKMVHSMSEFQII